MEALDSSSMITEMSSVEAFTSVIACRVVARDNCFLCWDKEVSSVASEAVRGGALIVVKNVHLFVSTLTNLSW